MKNKLIFNLVIIFLVIAAISLIYAYTVSLQSTTSSSQKLISSLKEFNSMTTYENVKSVLGEPSQISGLTREWTVGGGKVKIVFQQTSATSPQKVMRVEYIDASGEKVYSYKLLKD